MSQSVLKTDISTNNYKHDIIITLNLLPFFSKVELNKERLYSNLLGVRLI